MSEQLAKNIGMKTELNAYSRAWMDMNYTLVEKLEDPGTDIINSVWTVLGIWKGTTLKIVLDGTSNSVCLGARQSTIAGKLETIYTLEIPLKKKPMLNSEDIHLTGTGYILQNVCYVSLIGKSQSTLITVDRPVKVLTAIYSNVEGSQCLYLDLIKPEAGWRSLSQ